MRSINLVRIHLLLIEKDWVQKFSKIATNKKRGFQFPNLFICIRIFRSFLERVQLKYLLLKLEVMEQEKFEMRLYKKCI